ncbi:MAG: ketoacyl-ACP synthase III [Candidatus Brocadiae bacterium]|nr:ketoacyl-ACP synthase III [Candidatus Brocadiia bacterium]
MNPVYTFYKNKPKKIHCFCKILATASFVPEKSISNEDIIAAHNLPYKHSVISKTIGVESRRVAEEYEEDSDILVKSAQQCLAEAGIFPDQLSRIIVNKYLGDNLLPMTASKLQKKLGCKIAIHSFDIDAGISSFLYSLDAASRFINTGDEYILIASGGIHNRFVSKTNPRVAFLFGDASGSVVLGKSQKQHILASYFYTNHNYRNLAISFDVSGIKSSIRQNPEDMSFLYDTYQMDNWKIAEEFYKQATQEIVQNLLEESGLKIEDINLFLITENNRKIWEITLESLGISPDKTLSLLKDYGNTMSAMLPLLLDRALRTQRIYAGAKVMLLSHGEGINGGGMIYSV